MKDNNGFLSTVGGFLVSVGIWSIVLTIIFGVLIACISPILLIPIHNQLKVVYADYPHRDKIIRGSMIFWSIIIGIVFVCGWAFVIASHMNY